MSTDRCIVGAILKDVLWAMNVSENDYITPDLNILTWINSFHLIYLLYSIVSYRYGTSQQPHATYKTYDSHTLITMRIVTIQHMTQVYKCEYR